MLLTQVYVAPDARRGGLGRMLVQGMARDLIERGGIRAVEAFGDTRGDPGWDTHQPPQDHARGSRCVASVEFLGSVGFKTHRPHARHPRMRMDLRSALTWRDEVEAALEKLIGVVRPAPSRRTPDPRDANHRLTGETDGTRTTSKGPADGSAGPCRGEAQASMNSESSLSSAALGRAPTMDRTTSPFW